VAGTIPARSRPAAPEGHDPVAVDRPALLAAGDALRRAGYDNTPSGGALARLALGFTVDRTELTSGSAPAFSGLTEDVGVAVRLRGAILTTGEVLAYLPRDGRRPDRVYVGADTAFLVDAVGRLGPLAPGAGAGRAADLGTGTGVVAATLARRYRQVLATDLTRRAACTAMVTAALNRFPPGHRVHACVADVARGVTPGRFDLVAANAPWVPSDENGPDRRIFADGGPTGFELPRRFLTEGSALLRPGGILVALAVDVTFAGGRSPLRDLCALLERQGYTTVIIPTGLGRHAGDTERTVLPRVSGALAADHVAVVVARRPASTVLTAAVGDMAETWEGRAAELQ